MLNKAIRQRGRTFRRRCRQRRNARNDAVVDKPFDRKTVRLMQWLKANGFHQRPATLKVHDFPGKRRKLRSLQIYLRDWNSLCLNFDESGFLCEITMQGLV